MGRILVVDDEPELLGILKDLIEDVTDHEVVACRDGVEAFRRIRSERFDLISTDFQMPQFNGVDLVNSLKESGTNKNTKVLILSAYLDEAMSLCQEYGLEGVGFLTKPFREEIYVEKIKELMNAPLNQEHPSKKVNLVEPFSGALEKVLISLGGQSRVKIGRPQFFSRNMSLGIDISVSIGIQSEHFDGQVALGFSKKIFLELSNKLLNKNYLEFNEDNENTLSEIGNMLFVEAKKNLNEVGCEIKKNIPCVVTGENQSLKLDSSHVLLLLPVEIPGGKFWFHLMFNQEIV